jgi:hypothetical protein
LPLSAPAAVKLSVVEVCPGMSVKVAPPLMLTCHCTVGVGVPLAAAVNVAVWPEFTVRFAGLAVTAGATLTVSVAALELAVPAAFVNTARNWFPVWPAVAVKLRAVEVAPGMSLKMPPPSVLTCHWTVGAGKPLAAAVNVAVLPAHTVWGVGWLDTAGGTFTVRMAAVVVAVLHVLVNTARYCLPLSAPAAMKLRVVEVAPGMSLKVPPPFVLTCHCTVGLGVPLAAAVNVAVWPEFTVRFAGFAVTPGARLTVRVAALEVAVPAAFVNTARNWFPVWFAAAMKLRVVEVAPPMLLKVPPPSVLTCHWTVGAGKPLAAAVNVAVVPAHTVWGVGWVVTAGGTFTVKVAAVVVAVLHVFVNTARYCLPLSAPTAVKLSVVEVAPGMSLKVAPPLMLTCHCTVGLGVPFAAAVNVAVWPEFTVRFAGFAVTAGATLTVRVAALEVAVDTTFVNTARNWLPVWPAAAVKLRVVEVAPPMLLKIPPPSVLTCHWTVGTGKPLAAAVNVAVLPAQAVWLDGWAVTAGGW